MIPGDIIKLSALLIDEVSGVDDRANALPGFMVMKSEARENEPGRIPGTSIVCKSEGGVSYFIDTEKQTVHAYLPGSTEMQLIVSPEAEPVQRANPTQPRGASGRFRAAIEGVDESKEALLQKLQEGVRGIFRPANPHPTRLRG